MNDILNRLLQYNPPDRTVDAERQMAQDFFDAAEEIRRLRSALARSLSIELRQAKESLEEGDGIYTEGNIDKIMDGIK